MSLQAVVARVAFLLTIACFAIICTVSAATISLNNPSFETLPAGGLTSNSGQGLYSVGVAIPGWTVSATGSNYGQWHATSPFNFIPDGITVAYGNDAGTTISQNVLTISAAGVTYTLQVDLGLRSDSFDSLGTIQLLDGATAINGTGVAPALGNWSTFTATYTTTAADIGNTLGIRLAVTGQQSDFDNVRLSASATVPEPGTWLSCMAGLFVLGLAKRVACS